MERFRNLWHRIEEKENKAGEGHVKKGIGAYFMLGWYGNADCNFYTLLGFFGGGRIGCDWLSPAF